MLTQPRISAGVQNNTFTNTIHISHTKISPKLTYFFLQGKTTFGWIHLTSSIQPENSYKLGQKQCSLLHWYIYLGNRDCWKNLRNKHLQKPELQQDLNYTHYKPHTWSLFGLFNEQYFVQISTAIKEIFNTRYITSYVQGALNAHTVHIVLSLSI